MEQLIQAWASHKSFQPKPAVAPDDTGDGDTGDEPPAPPPPPAEPTPAGRNRERDWRGHNRRNETHARVTDPDARLARKSNGQASILAYAGHVLMEIAMDWCRRDASPTRAGRPSAMRR